MEERIMINQHLGKIEPLLNTDTGELTLKIYDPEDEEKLLLNKTMKLSHNDKTKDIIVRFTFENHPETGENETFKGFLFKRRYYAPWRMLIYPQFGSGSITDDKLKVESEGNDEFFS